MSSSEWHPDNDIPDLTDKIFFVTGGTAGLGAKTVAELAKHRPKHIYFAGRSATAAQTLLKRLQAGNATVDVTFLQMDLASFASIREAAANFHAKQPDGRLDALICGAAAGAVGADTTEEGYEVQFGTNHVGHALLIKLLLPSLKKTTPSLPNGDGGRIVLVTSTDYTSAPGEGIEFDTLKTAQKDLGPALKHKAARNAQAKLANLLYAGELAKHEADVTTVAVAPGTALTNVLDGKLGQKIPGASVPMEKAAFTQLWAATAPRSELKSGEYYEPYGQVAEKKGKHATDGELAQRLWEWTEKEIGSA